MFQLFCKTAVTKLHNSEIQKGNHTAEAIPSTVKACGCGLYMKYL
jgi:hypothetical protein